MLLPLDPLTFSKQDSSYSFDRTKENDQNLLQLLLHNMGIDRKYHRYKNQAKDSFDMVLTISFQHDESKNMHPRRLYNLDSTRVLFMNQDVQRKKIYQKKISNSLY